MTPLPSHLRLACLDARLSVTTDLPALHEALEGHLGAFSGQEEGSQPGESGWMEVRFFPPPPRVLTPRGERVLDPEAALEQAYGLVFRELLDAVERFLVLHAGAVEAGGKAFLLAGPSGTGKTTLTLALAEAGLKLLSDDFSPLERSTGLVHLFPKSLGVRPGPGQEFARRLSRPCPEEGERTLPPDIWAAGPCPLGGLVLFDGGPCPASPWTPFAWKIDVAGDPQAVAGLFNGIEGVERLSLGESHLLLKIDPGRASARSIEQALAAASGRILQYGTVGWGPPTAGKAPALLPLSPDHAGLLLLRELQNRRPEGRLLRSLSHDLARLAAEMAGMLKHIPCAWLVPGPPAPTAALLAGLFRENRLEEGRLPGSWSV